MSDHARLTTIAPVTERRPTAADLLLQFEVEQFFYHEAALLDERRYTEWLQLFATDVRYWMPIRRTVSSQELSQEFTKPGEMAFIDDDYQALALRVKRLGTGYAWAEDPPSRVRRSITNIRIVANSDDEWEVHSNFYIYRARLEAEEVTWNGRRVDRLRRIDDNLRICGRSIYLDQTILLSSNLSNFF